MQELSSPSSRSARIATVALVLMLALSSFDVAAAIDIHAAIRAGDTEAVQAAAKDGAELNRPDGWGRTPLIIALQQGNHEWTPEDSTRAPDVIIVEDDPAFCDILEYALRQEGYTFLPLSRAVAGLRGQPPLPDKAVAITVDDGHRSVYTELLPILRREHLPVALFIYPSAISNASYAMTWEQLAELQATGLVEIHSHTYWHPNFHTEKKRLAPEAYAAFVEELGSIHEGEVSEEELAKHAAFVDELEKTALIGSAMGLAGAVAGWLGVQALACAGATGQSTVLYCPSRLRG